MHELLSIDQIKQRAGQIDLSMHALARKAGVSVSTAWRAGQHDHRGTTLRKLTAALIELEIKQRDHLVALHGLPDLPEDCDTVRVGGVLRRINKPAIGA